MKIVKQKFGMLSDGTKVNLYTVKNDKMSFSCTDYGCTLTSIVINKDDGTKTDVLLGFSTLEGYLNTKFCFGSIVGRFANRIGKASFTLNDTKYQLDKNDGPNTLHGGFDGYDKMMWSAKEIKKKNYCGVKFTRISPDGEQGMPGNVKLEVTYLLDDNNNLTCYYTATTDKPTPINITNHAYFNLAGKGSVKNHTVKMNSDYILEVDSKLIPTGNLLPVKDTPFDFTTEKKIEEVKEQVYHVDENLLELEKSKDSIISDMGELTKLGENNSQATEMIVTDFNKVVKHSGEMTNVTFSITNASEELYYLAKENQNVAGENLKEKKHLRVGYMSNYGSLCSIVPAMKLGYLEQENLEVELIPFANGMKIIDALKEGALEIGYIGDGAHKRCIAGDAKIFLLSHVSNAEAVIGSRRSGVRNLQALKGMRIGTSEGNSSDTILNLALESVNIDRSDCEIVNLTPEEIINEMTAGRLDACALWSPYTFELQKKMGNDAVLLANNLNFSNRLASLSSWITSDAFAASDKETLLQFTRAIYRGMDYRAMEENMKKVAGWVAEVTGGSADSLYAQRRDADWSTKGYVAIGVTDGTVEKLYEAQQKNFLKNGAISHSVPVGQYVLLDNMSKAVE